MFTRAKCDESLVLGPDEGKDRFHRSDVLFALEWSAVAPGMGGWDVLLDDDRDTCLLSVVPPGADAAAFYLYKKGREVVLRWLAPRGAAEPMEVGRFTTVRAALLALCPLNDEQMRAVHESMEILYPRSLRSE